MIKKIKGKLQQRKIEKALHKEYLRSIPSHFDDFILKWRAPEHHIHKRDRFWQISTFGMLLAATILGVLNDAWTFSLAVVVFALVYYILNKKSPEHVDILVSDIGIKVGHRKYPYSQIKAFWIIYDPPVTQTLYITVDKDLLTHIPIQMRGQNPSHLREFLAEKVPEREGQHYPLSDIFARLFRI